MFDANVHLSRIKHVCSKNDIALMGFSFALSSFQQSLDTMDRGEALHCPCDLVEVGSDGGLQTLELAETQI